MGETVGYAQRVRKIAMCIGTWEIAWKGQGELDAVDDGQVDDVPVWWMNAEDFHRRLPCLKRNMIPKMDVLLKK